MNRRKFIQSLAAVFALPAAPKLAVGSVGMAAPAVATVPKQARFWAIYMSALHGECTPQTLQNLLHIPEADSKRYVSQLITDGVIKPNPLLENAVSELVRPKDESFAQQVNRRFEKKETTEPVKLEVQEEAGPECNSDQDADVDPELSGEDVQTHHEEQSLSSENEEAVTTSFENDSER